MKRDGHVLSVELLSCDNVGQAPNRPFLTLHRLSVQNVYIDKKRSAAYSYDAVLRKGIDAVAIILTTDVNGKMHVCLRTCIRPPLLLRKDINLPIPDEGDADFLWEIPAGIIEPGEHGVEAIKQRAAAECFEETGYKMDWLDFELLKGASFVSPGVIPERIWYVRAKVADPDIRSLPQGDGSPVEDRAQIWWVSLEEALSMCDEGEVNDMKTELGLRRLAALHTY